MVAAEKVQKQRFKFAAAFLKAFWKKVLLEMLIP
jgi:hypothetical protein